MVETVVLSPLPFRQPDRLVRMFNAYPGLGGVRDGGNNAAPDFFFRRERVPGLAEVAAFRDVGSTVGEAGSVERVPSLRVTLTGAGLAVGAVATFFLVRLIQSLLFGV